MPGPDSSTIRRSDQKPQWQPYGPIGSGEVVVLGTLDECLADALAHCRLLALQVGPLRSQPLPSLQARTGCRSVRRLH
jgi:hypothetical protein